MADRRVKLILEAQVDQFNQRMRQSRDETDRLGNSLREAVSRPEMQQLGRGLTAFGTLTVGALGMATKSAMDWETAWTDVMRRTEGTPQQLNNLENALRGIATELPTTHAEVAEVAASAAQLGVAVGDVEEFTRVMIDMGNSTNLTADQAATAMARFSNIMGTPTEEMSNLGSAVVDLGNNSATTESEIMDMAQRLAGAANEAGISEGEVLGLAAAMSSLGIRSQAGGTALTRTMNTIGLEVDTNGEKLETFAETAGMTADEFATAWEEDATGALMAFIEGLSTSEERGQSMNEVLQELGITSEREADALRRLASDVDLTTESVERGAAAYEENTAMAEEAGYVYDTVAAQLKAFWSNINDVAIELGQAFLPALEASIDQVGKLVTAFANLPDPAKNALAAVSGFVGVGSLAAGSFLLLAPGIFQTVDALKGLGMIGPRTNRVMRGFSRALPGIAAGMVTIGALDYVWDQFAPAAPDIRETRLALEELAETGNQSGPIEDYGLAIAELDSTGGKLRDNIPGWAAGLLTGFNPAVGTSIAASQNLSESFANVDQSLADMLAEGNIDGVAANVKQMAEDFRANDEPVSKLHRVLPELGLALGEAGIGMDEFLVAIGESNLVLDEATGTYKESELTLSDLKDRMTDTEQEALESALGVEDLDEALGGMGESAEEAALSLSELVTQLMEAGLLNRDARAAARDYEQSLDALNTSIEENGYTLDTTTEAGRNNEAALDAIADAGVRSAQAMADNGASQEELQESLTGTYGDLVAAAEKFGITGQEAHEMAAEILGVPDSVEVTSDMDETAQNIAEWLNSELDEVERPRLATILAESNTGLAESDLTETARERISDVIAEPDSVTAEGELTDTARDRIADILADSDTWDAEADFNETARDRIADIFADPDSWTAEGELNETARKRIADITADPDSYNADRDLNHTARDRESMITAEANTWYAETSLNRLSRNRSANINVTTSGAGAGAALGGSLFSTGGAVRGPGTPTSDSIPARLSNGEHVLTAREVALMGGQAGVYNFRSNLTGNSRRPSGRDMVPAYANGGAVQARQIAAAMQGGGGSDSHNGGPLIGQYHQHSYGSSQYKDAQDLRMTMSRMSKTGGW